MQLIIGFEKEDNKEELMLAVIDKVLVVSAYPDHIEYYRHEEPLEELQPYHTAKPHVWFRCLDDTCKVIPEYEAKLIDEMLKEKKEKELK